MRVSVKVKDARGRWRSKTVSFRMSPEENELLASYARLSGMTKQDYMIARLLRRDIVVHGNPKVFKALRGQIGEMLTLLRRIEAAGRVEADCVDRLEWIIRLMEGMNEENDA